MIVAGVMSGTSADGINVALVRVTAGRDGWPTFKCLAHAEYPYPGRVRQTILRTMNAPEARVADLARLNFLLAELYAEAILAAQRRFGITVGLVGCHGQTLYHQGEVRPFAGRRLAVTWQTGEGAVIAARVGVPVVSDFRPADMAHGGRGAPLVPFLDYLQYRDTRVGRIIQNIGGIANLTAIPVGASLARVMAFDTGPGNMVIDAVSGQLCGKPYDRDGHIASSGLVLDRVVMAILRGRFFQQPPPKTAGREEFGREFVAKFLRRCSGASNADVVATATALTARSIAEGIRRFVLPTRKPYAELVVSGGGTKNPVLMGMLAEAVRRLDLAVRKSDEFGLPSDAKEAIAFALLAYQTWEGRPSNLPSATGAKRPAILGKLSYA